MAADNITRDRDPSTERKPEASPLKDRPALNDPLLEEANHPGQALPKQSKIGDLAFLDEKNKPKDASDKALEKIGDIKVTDNMRNAVGAYVKVDKYDNVEFLERKDKSRVIPKWETDKNDKKVRFDSFDEVQPDHRTQRTWTREGEGNDFTTTDAKGNKLVLRNVQFDKSNDEGNNGKSNGNFSFTRDELINLNGKTFTVPKDYIVRGSGSRDILATDRGAGKTDTQYKFDAEGCMTHVIPSKDAFNKGAPSYAFSYIHDPKTGKQTEKLESVIELKVGQKPVGHEAREGESLTRGGEYRYPDATKDTGVDQDGKPTVVDVPVTRIHFPGTLPQQDLLERYFDSKGKSVDKRDGASTIAHFDMNNNCVAVQGFNENGKPLKQYIRNIGQHQITAIDHTHGDVTIWTEETN